MKIATVKLFISTVKVVQYITLSIFVLSVVIPSTVILVSCSPQDRIRPDLTADQPTALDPHPRIMPMGRDGLMVTVLSTGPKATAKDALSRVSLIVNKSTLEHVPAAPATANTSAAPEGISILWTPKTPNLFGKGRVTTDSSTDFSLRLFFGNDGSSKVLPLLHGAPIDNHIHVIPKPLARSVAYVADVTLFVPNPIAGQTGPVCKGSYIEDFLSKVDAVPASADTPAKPWGIRVSEFYSLPWQEHEGTVCISLRVPTVFRDDGAVEQEPASLECTEMKPMVVTIKGKNGKEEQRTRFQGDRFTVRPITDNKTQVLDLARGWVALLLRDYSPSAKGPRFVGVYDSRQLEKNDASATISVSEFHLMSDGRVLKLTRIFRENGPLAHLAVVEDRLLDNRAQEVALAGERTAVFVEDTQPGASGPLLKEIRETYPAALFPLELLGKAHGEL